MDLFISYAHADRRRVEQDVVNLLRNGGHNPWYDLNLTVGQDWQAELFQTIAEADAVIYVLSPTSVRSEWCEWEVQSAMKLGKAVIPIMLKKTVTPDFLATVQYVDFVRGADATSTARLLSGLRSLEDAQQSGKQLDEINVTIAHQSTIGFQGTVPDKPEGLPAQVTIKSGGVPRVLLAVVAVLIAIGIVGVFLWQTDRLPFLAVADVPTATITRAVATSTATARQTATDSVTDTPTRTPTETPEPTITANAQALVPKLFVNPLGINIRDIPYGDVSGGSVIQLGLSGQEYSVIGRNSSSTWFKIQVGTRLTGWVFNSAGMEIRLGDEPLASDQITELIPVISTPSPP